MRLLVDTDIFCKLAAGGVLREAVARLGADLSECGRLSALPHMLRKGKLTKTYDPKTCRELISLANEMQVVMASGNTWLDKLTPVRDIDPGEALIFAAAAEMRLLVMSGDKRALRALKDVDGIPDALAWRIVALEPILIALCDSLGSDELRRRFRTSTMSDKVVRVCFSDENPDPRAALISYYESLAVDLAPLQLWDPWQGGGE